MSRTMDALAGGVPGRERWMTRDAWLEARREGLGSSDAAAVLGLSRWRTPLHVYLSKVGEMEDEDNGRKKWGRLLEDVVAHAYEEETGHRVVPPPLQVMKHPLLPWQIASLDRVVYGADDRPRVLEIKCVSRASDEWGEPGTDQVPDEYLIQVQHQLAVTGWQVAEVAALVEQEELRVYHVPRNEELIRRLTDIESDFWALVTDRKPPAVDYRHPKAVEALKALYVGVDDAVCIDLGGEEAALAEEHRKVRMLRAAGQSRLEEIKAILLGRMACAGAARLPNGYFLSRKIVKRGGYSVAPTSYVDFRVKAPRGLAYPEDA